MATEQVTIRVTWKKATKSFSLSPTAKCGELRTSISRWTRLSVHRISLKQGTTTRLNDMRASLGDALLIDNGEASVTVRDLGPQFSYRGVFVVEYAGPLVIMLWFASRPALVYGDGATGGEWAWSARLGVACWLIHFAKRELETFFVHQFSRATMPLANLFKNSIYYWTFAAVVGFTLCHPMYVAAADWASYGALLAWIACQVWNFSVHVALRRAGNAHRRAQAQATGGANNAKVRRRPPSGPLFARVSCPNYTAEVGGWLAFSVMTNTFYGYVFTAVGLAQMAVWARKKHRAYVKQEPGYAFGPGGARRHAIVPFVL